MGGRGRGEGGRLEEGEGGRRRGEEGREEGERIVCPILVCVCIVLRNTDFLRLQCILRLCVLQDHV